MHNPNQESAISGPINLLKHYSFESNRHSYETVLDSWLERFPLSWVNLALIESLYQGRYKVVSVEQILTLWQRRGKPSYHFNHDFERLVSNNLPETFETNRAIPSQKSTKVNLKSIRHRSIQRNKRNDSRRPTLPNSQDFGTQAKLINFYNAPEQDESQALNTNSTRPSLYPQNSPEQPDQLSTNDLSATSELDPNTTIITSSQSTKETTSDVTEPTTIKDGVDPDFIESKEQSESDLHPLSIISEGPSEIDSDADSSYSPVPLHSPVSDTVQPIHQFVPQSSSTGFHSKLTAMAQVNV